MTASRIYGIAEIAQALGVRRQTVAQWHKPGQLPPTTEDLAMGPVWMGQDIQPWLDKKKEEIQLTVREREAAAYEGLVGSQSVGEFLSYRQGWMDLEECAAEYIRQTLQLRPFGPDTPDHVAAHGGQEEAARRIAGYLRHQCQYTAAALAAALNQYDGDNPWEDVVRSSRYDGYVDWEATEAVDMSGRSDLVVLVDDSAVIYDEAAGQWRVADDWRPTVRTLLHRALARGHVVTAAAGGNALDEDDWQDDLRGHDEEGEYSPGAPIDPYDPPVGAAVPGDIDAYEPVGDITGTSSDVFYVVWRRR